ncbi:MAG: hypothetical protein ACI9U2_005000 [Bradymonadia bacterium]|jgi:hypothetical protein
MMRWIPVLLGLTLAISGCDDESPTQDPRGMGGAGGGMGGAGGVGPDMAVPVPAMIAITSPINNTVVPGPFVDVTGSYTGPDSAITVNGEMATIEGGIFTARVLLDGGEQVITASGGAVQDSITVQVDASPPRIDIQSPPRGTWTENGQLNLLFTITDDAGLERVTFDSDREVNPGLGPDFALNDLPLAAGLNILRLEAFDVPGNFAKEHVAVLQGPLQDPDARIPGAVRLHIGAAGLDSLEQVALRLLRERDLTALLPNPLFEGGPFRAEISTITYRDPPILELTPGNGVLSLRLRLEQLVITMSLQIGDNDVYQISAGAGAVDITAEITPRVRDGALFIPLDELEIVFDDLQLRPGDVPRFDDNPEEGQTLIEEVAGVAMRVVAEQYIPDLIDSLLGRIDDPIDLDLLGAQLQIQLVPDVVVVSPRGLSIRLDAGVVFLGETPPGPSLPGYVGTRQPWDGVPDTDGIGIAIDDDLLNLLMFQVWRTGVLLPRIDSSTDLGQMALVSTLLGNLARRAHPDLPASTPIALETTLPLPPVAKVEKADGAVGLTIGLGDMSVAFMTDDAEARSLVNGAASLVLRSALGVVQDPQTGAITLDLVVSETIGLFDVIDEALRGAAENEMEAQVNNLLGIAGSVLPALLGGFEIPSIDLVTFTGLRTDVSGPDGTFITIYGDVE